MRNRQEQIDFILKHRRDAMPTKDFLSAIESLANMCFTEGYNEGVESALATEYNLRRSD